MGRRLAAIVATAAATILVASAWLLVGGSTTGGVSTREQVTIGTIPSQAVLPANAAVPFLPLTTPLLQSERVPPPVASQTPYVPDIPVSSGFLPSLAQEPVNPPVAIRIADLSITAEVAPVGYDARNDEMEVPASSSLVGWYEFSPAPGDAGSAVLAAHVDWNGRRGTFHDLHSIDEGAIITIDYADGTQRRFEVFAARQYDKASLPVDDIFAKSGDPVLTLVTCGGLFDGARGSYQDNIVVYARPAGSLIEAPSARI